MDNLQVFIRLLRDIFDAYKDDVEGFRMEFEDVVRRVGLDDNKKIKVIFEFGEFLYKNAIFNFALYVWETMLRYGLDNKLEDITKESFYIYLGLVYHESLHQCRQAIDYYDKALAIAAKIGHLEGEESCYGNIAHAYTDLNQYQQAIDYYNKALAIAAKTENEKSEIGWYAGLGQVYYFYDSFQQAIYYFNKALELAKCRDPERLSGCYGNLGIAYFGLGHYQRAIDYYYAALDLELSSNDIVGAKKSYGNLANVYYRLGSYQYAIDIHNKALAIAIKIIDVHGEAICYSHIGAAHFRLGNYQQAIDYHKKALDIAIQIEDRGLESRCYGNLALVYSEQGNYQQAIEYTSKALELAKRVGDIPSEAIAYTKLGESYQSLGLKDKAYSNYKLAIDLDELMGYNLEEYYRMAFTRTFAGDYDHIINVCLEMKNDFDYGENKKTNDNNSNSTRTRRYRLLGEAFEYVERNKSRAFLVMLSATTDIRPSNILEKKYPDLLEKEKVLRLRLKEMQSRPLANIKSRDAETNFDIPIQKITTERIDPNELGLLRKELDEVYDTMNEVDDEYVSLRRGSPSSFDNILVIL